MGKSLQNVRNKLLDTAIFYGVLFVVPAVTTSIARSINIGWQNIFYFHIGLALAITFLYLLRKKLSLVVKAYCYALIYGSINFIGGLSFGIYSGIAYFVLTVVVITLILDKKTGIYCAFAMGVLYFMLLVLNTTGINVIKIDFNKYNTALTAWIMILIGLIYIFMVIINTVGEYNKFFISNIQQLNNKVAELNQTQLELIMAKESAEGREKQLRQISDNFESGMIYQIVAKDENTRSFTYLSESVNRFYGCSAAEAYERPELIYDRLDPSDKIKVIELEKESLQNMSVFRVEVRSYKPDGSLRWVYLVSKPRRQKGYIIWDGLEIDITERKLAEEQLQVLKQSIDIAPDAAFWLNEEGQFLYVNETATTSLDYTRDELMHMKIGDINPIATEENWRKVWNIVKEQRSLTMESVHMRKNGVAFPIELATTYIKYEGKEYNHGFARDITERKKAEEALRLSEEKFRNIFSKTGDGVIICTFDNIIILTNASFANMLGYSIDELTGSSLKNYLYDNYYDHMSSQFELLHGIDSPPFEYYLRNKDGSQVYVQMHSNMLDYERSKAILSVIRDITVKKLEEKTLKTALVLAEENERERLARDLHDGLGPLLSASKIYVHNIKNREDCENIDLQINRLEHIINEAIISVKEISNNISPHVLRNFGLIKAIKTFLSKLTICDRVQTNFFLDESKRYAEVYEITLYRTIAELLNNTTKYAEAQNVVITLKEEYSKLQLWYSDNGKGFDFEVTIQNRRGLGLFNIISRVKSLGGYVNFNSNPGEGMMVYIELNC